MTSEQGHKRRRKWLQALVIGFEGRFSTNGVADQHDHKVNDAQTCRSVCGRSERARRSPEGDPDGSWCERSEPLPQTIGGPRQPTPSTFEDSPRKDGPYSYNAPVLLISAHGLVGERVSRAPILSDEAAIISTPS